MQRERTSFSKLIHMKEKPDRLSMKNFIRGKKNWLNDAIWESLWNEVDFEETIFIIEFSDDTSVKMNFFFDRIDRRSFSLIRVCFIFFT